MRLEGRLHCREGSVGVKFPPRFKETNKKLRASCSAEALWHSHQIQHHVDSREHQGDPRFVAEKKVTSLLVPDGFLP